MTNPYRALCAELVKDFDDLRESSEGVAGFHRNGDLAPWEELSESGRYPWLSSFDRARALLAEADGPAVPDGREPASVALQPSDAELDELAWTWYSKTGSTWYQIEAFRAYARAVLARWSRPTPQPVPVSERLPEPNVKVLAYYFNALGNGRTICAIWVPAKSRSDEGDLDADDFLEYDEEGDKYYWPEGWYEAIENWDELGWVKVYEGEIVYWQPLPKWPAHALPTPEATND